MSRAAFLMAGVRVCEFGVIRCVLVQSLLPEKRMLFQPNLAKAVGSDYIKHRVEELRPMAHIFGHTHFAWDAVVGQVRYVQWPLAYPQERK